MAKQKKKAKTGKKAKPKTKKVAPKVKAIKKSSSPGTNDVTLHAMTAVTETACLTGAWTPVVSVNDNIDIGDKLGNVVFSGLSCDVSASEAGVVSWVRIKSQVNLGYAVCMIEPGVAIPPIA